MFWLYIYIHEQFSLFDSNTNFLTGFMISLFLAATAQRVRRAWDLMILSAQNGLRFFLLFGKKYFFIQNLSFLINNVFWKRFSSFKSYRLNNAVVCETPMLKKYLNYWKKWFLDWQFIENQAFIISPLFPYFSVFSLFKLVQFLCLVMES